ncbi:Hypothetical predicted protein, partial [Marmota monax]
MATQEQQASRELSQGSRARGWEQRCRLHVERPLMCTCPTPDSDTCAKRSGLLERCLLLSVQQLLGSEAACCVEVRGRPPTFPASGCALLLEMALMFRLLKWHFLLSEAPPVKKLDLSELPDPQLDLSQDCMPNEKTRSPWDLKATLGGQEADFFPPVEGLHLSEFRRPPDATEHWASEEEIRRFWKLRQEIVENEKAQVLEQQLLPIELPPNLKAALSSKGKEHLKPRSLL